MQGEQRNHFEEAKRMGRKHSRHGCAKESENEGAEQPVNHDSGVSLPWVKFSHTAEMKRPERHTDHPGEDSDGKENAKRFPSDVFQGYSL